MSYFKLFPKTPYPYNAAGDRKACVDILKRFTFSNAIKSNADLYVRYNMRETDTFQSLAKKLYGSPDLHWILYLMNDIVDPYTDGPKTSSELNTYISKKYQGYVLMLDLSFDGDFQVGESVTSGSYFGTVVAWDATLRKLTMTSENAGDRLSVGDVITGSTSGSTGGFKRRVINTSAVHHFEDLFGNKISPLPNPTIPNDDSPLDGYLDQAEQPNVKIVSNTEYEISANDELRKIKVLRVEFRDQILRDAQRIFQ